MQKEQWTKKVPTKPGFYMVKVKDGTLEGSSVEIFREYKFFGKLMIKAHGVINPYKFRLRDVDNIAEWKRLNR